jgi:hypothetical protein
LRTQARKAETQKEGAQGMSGGTQQVAHVMDAVLAEFDDADAYGFRRPVSPAVIAEAKRQWDAIPTDPAAIAVWMRGEPINGVKP